MRHSDDENLHELARYAIRGAELYALARRPLPVCHPGTRASLLEEIVQWMKSGESNLLWVHGPAGAGKTAVAQTTGEATVQSFSELEFIAAFFFSRLRGHDDPTRFWTSICHQLVKRYMSFIYWRMRTSLNDNTLFEADNQTQFKKLVLPILTALGSSLVTRIIIIDGLDECRGEEEQCQIIKTICDDIPQAPNIRWLIFSRPEPHLKRAFEEAQSQDLCQTIQVPTDGPETMGDIERYLKDGFARISNSYLSDQASSENWPKADDLEKIFRAASGIFVYAATILKFVDDSTTRDPISQLQTVINFIDGLPLAPGATNPLAFIDKLYLEIIGRTPHEVLPTTLRVLRTCAVCPPLPVLHLAHLLELDVRALYDSLRAVHSLISVPSESNLGEEPLRYFHASLPDFLMNSDRSGRLAQDGDTCRLRLAETLYCVLETPELSHAKQIFDRSSRHEDDEFSPLPISDAIMTYASIHVWDISTRISNPPMEFSRCTVGTFSFRCLELVMETIPPLPFIKFLRWFRQSTTEFAELRGLVRTTPQFDMDTRLISACEPLARPLNLESQGEDGLEESPQYVLVGFEDQIVIILITHETVIIYSSPEGLGEEGPTEPQEEEERPLDSQEEKEIHSQFDSDPRIFPTLSVFFMICFVFGKAIWFIL